MKTFDISGTAHDMLMGVAYRRRMSPEDVLHYALVLMKYADEEAVRGNDMASINADGKVITRYKVFKRD